MPDDFKKRTEEEQQQVNVTKDNWDDFERICSLLSIDKFDKETDSGFLVPETNHRY